MSKSPTPKYPNLRAEEISQGQRAAWECAGDLCDDGQLAAEFARLKRSGDGRVFLMALFLPRPNRGAAAHIAAFVTYYGIFREA